MSSLETHLPESLIKEGAQGAVYFPHYYSTYCQHDIHHECRLTCKHCEAPCRCRCHKEP